MSDKAFKHKITFRNRQNKTLEVSENESILDVFEAAGWVLPVACRYGGCITCAAKMISGSVRQPKGTAVNKRQSQDGYVLLCVARPKEKLCFLMLALKAIAPFITIHLLAKTLQFY